MLITGFSMGLHFSFPAQPTYGPRLFPGVAFRRPSLPDLTCLSQVQLPLLSFPVSHAAPALATPEQALSYDKPCALPSSCLCSLSFFFPRQSSLSEASSIIPTLTLYLEAMRFCTLCASLAPPLIRRYIYSI